MKALNALIGLWMLIPLVACEGNTGGNSNPPDPKPPVKEEQKTELKWGDLECQKVQACDNPVLNKSLSAISNYISESFYQEMNSPDANHRIFLCGKKAQEEWMRHFSSPLSNKELMELGRFQRALLDVETCTPKPSVLNIIDSYFQDTKEYKNEIR